MSVRTGLGAAALAALVLLGGAIAAGGPAAAPGAGDGGLAWLDGAFGAGLGVGGGSYIWLERASLLAYALVVACAGSLPRRALWLAIWLLAGAFVLAPVLLSQDAFSYLAYAELDLSHGLNPYQHSPDAVPREGVFELVRDNRALVSVYGPLFTVLTLPLAALPLQLGVALLKLLAAGSVLVAAWIAARLAAARGADPRLAAALVALNPLVLVHVIGGAHNDALMAALMSAGLAGVALGLPRAGGFSLLAAAGTKAAALLAAPFALLAAAAADGRAAAAARPRGAGAGEPVRRRGAGAVALGMAAGAALVLALGLGRFGSASLEAIEVVRGNQALASTASLPVWLAELTGLELDTVQAAAAIAFVAALGWLLWRVARGADWVAATGWAFVAALLASSYVTPWYVIWALPPAAVSRSRGLVAATVALSAFLLREQVLALGG